MSRDWTLSLLDMLTCCEAVNEYAIGLNRNNLRDHRMAYDAILRNIEIIGEAAKKIPKQVRSQMPDVEWSKVCGMRDWLAHGYHNINEGVVWDVVKISLPVLQNALETYRKQHPELFDTQS